ncbi:MAG TPA: tetratricopeptide repeat protein [Candidatus Angelobacter sp.]|jgi:tetratricopeptide (TPR) repeat protein|nr:tetratricopeptide repeat protein [Candidatus Angelobacter sp.]
MNSEAWTWIGKFVAGAVATLAALSGIVIAWRNAIREKKKEAAECAKPASVPANRSGGINITDSNVKAHDFVGHDNITNITNTLNAFKPAKDSAALYQLPSPPADFTGRTDELAELLQAVKKGGVTISGLHGMGGVGKTALALKLAEQLKPDYTYGQFYLDLKGVNKDALTPKEAMAHVVRAYDFTAQLPEGEAEVAALYRSVLHGKKALLLMDNARDARQVEPLLPPSGCLLLVTSRRHFTLPGLVEKNLDALPPGDAEALLLEIAPRIADAGTECVANLARLCGYLPLALRSVGSVLKERINLSPAGYARKLEDTSKRRQELSQVDVSLQASYELLAGELQKRFCALAVFPDTFDLAAAAAIWEAEQDAAEEDLGELLLYSLVSFDAVTTRYHLHDLVRWFADGRLPAKERQVLASSHARHYLNVIETAHRLYERGGESVIKGLALFDLEWGNIQAAQAWAASLAMHDDTAAELCSAYPNTGGYLLLLRQHPRERIGWLEPALAAARRLKDRAGEAAALGNLGLAYFDVGEYRRAIEYHEQRLQIDRDTGDRLGESRALGNLGIAYDSLGEYRRAIEYHEQHLQITRDIGDRLGEGRALGNLGLAYYSLGEHRRAVEYHEQHLQIARDIGDRVGEGRALGNLGIAYDSLGEYRRALEHYEQRLQIARDIGHRDGEGHALWNSSLALDQMGNRAEAIANAEAALRVYEQIELPFASSVRDQLAKWRAEDD